jgi:hypothetical protein
MESGLSIGTLSKQSGVNIETIRYYEKIGIMPKPARTGGGFRAYTQSTLSGCTSSAAAANSASPSTNCAVSYAWSIATPIPARRSTR